MNLILDTGDIITHSRFSAPPPLPTVVPALPPIIPAAAAVSTPAVEPTPPPRPAETFTAPQLQIMPAAQTYRCEVEGCKKYLRSFGTQTALDEHNRAVHSLRAAVAEIQQVLSETQTTNTEDTMPTKFKCNQCPKTFTLAQGLRMHQARAHGNMQGNPHGKGRKPHPAGTRYGCAICDKIFEKYPNVKQHLKAVHHVGVKGNWNFLPPAASHSSASPAKSATRAHFESVISGPDASHYIRATRDFGNAEARGSKDYILDTCRMFLDAGFTKVEIGILEQ